MTDYLTVADMLAIHEDLIRRYGGRAGVRDFGALESALARPQSGYYADLVAEAAALWESLAQNHPFLDGNKRAAFACMYTFLAINHVAVTAKADAAWHFIADLYEQQAFRFDRLEPWLRANTTPAEPEN